MFFIRYIFKYGDGVRRLFLKEYFVLIFIYDTGIYMD